MTRRRLEEYHSFALLETQEERARLERESPESHAAYLAFVAVESVRNADENRRLTQENKFHPLTREFGVYNKIAFDEALEEIAVKVNLFDRRTTDPEAIVLIYTDGDNFKDINDKFGHPEGDEAIKALALAHTKAARNIGDIVGCDGGDEFVIGLEVREHILTAEQIAELWVKRDMQLCRELTEARILRGGPTYNLSCTYGASIWRPTDLRPVLEAKKEAETRMRANKPPNRRR